MTTMIISRTLTPCLRVSEAARSFPSSHTKLKRILVIADHNNEKVYPATFKAIAGAKEVGGTIELLLATNKPEKIIPQVERAQHVNKILVANHKLFEQVEGERMAPVVVSLHDKNPFTHIITGSYALRSGILVVVAAKLGVGLMIRDTGTGHWDTPFYRGITKRVEFKDSVKTLSAQVESDKKATVEEVEIPIDQIAKIAELAELMYQERYKEHIQNLNSVEVVDSNGRGLGSKDYFELIYKLALSQRRPVRARRVEGGGGMLRAALQYTDLSRLIIRATGEKLEERIETGFAIQRHPHLSRQVKI